jgi:hypothetical protein
MNTKLNLFVLFIILAQALAACGSPATQAPPEPTAVPPATAAPTSQPTAAPDPATVVQGFWNAMAVGNLNDALQLISDDAKCRGACYITGKDSLQAYLQGYVDAGLVTEISDVAVSGDMVTYSYKVFREGLLVEESAEAESMQVLNGKIILWNNLRYIS